MTRTENELREALLDLERRADVQGAPSTASILSATTEQLPRHRDNASRRVPGWVPPLTAAGLVAAAAVTTVTLSSQNDGASHARTAPAGGRSTTGTVATSSSSAAVRHHPALPAPSAAGVLEDAAAQLDAAPSWTAPDPQDFFYVRTTEATTWTSISGRQAGDGRTARGKTVWISGCQHGQIVSGGESGPCTIDQVPHYLGDAPTTPPAWDAYLERIAPGAKAGGAQGKIIASVLHQDLLAPKAAAALLRYTKSCPGLHVIPVQPVGSEQLTGVTCTSMTNGSYGLAFDADSHRLAGFVGVNASGHQVGPAEIIRRTGIVPALGRTP